MVQKYTYLSIFLNDLHQSLTLSEFEKYYSLPHQTIKRHLQPLIKNNILKNNNTKYSLNLNNHLTLEYLIICEKERFFEFIQKPKINFLYEFLEKHLQDSKIIVFGSSVNQKKFNDIDILLLNKNKEILNSLKQFEDTIGIKVHIVTQTPSYTLKQEIIKQHIIFSNHEELTKWMYLKKFDGVKQKD